MNEIADVVKPPFNLRWHTVAGIVLCTAGGMMLVGQLLRLEWLSLMAPGVSGLILLAVGLKSHKRGYLMAGSLVLGTAIGILIALTGFRMQSPFQQAGIVILGLAAGFGAITVLLLVLQRRLAWWPLIPCAAVGGLGFTLSFTQAGIFDFILYLLTGLGLVFLAIGIYKRWIGLIIPGCLLISLGPGLAFAWGKLPITNSLAQTGVMLVWFAFGWALITVFSRVVIEQFVWWPLIPGGILAVVGWGLYIGGNPSNAVRFIGNTGSVAMVIFGLYLLLMRRGIRH